MPDKLMIIMTNTDPHDGAAIGAPFFQATVAAAMDYTVEMILTGRSGELAKQGVAEQLYLQAGDPKTVYDCIKEAHAAGVIFKVCTTAIELWGSDLIPEIDETIGTAYVISEAMSDDTVTFTY